MSQHTHSEYVEGCFRCELGRDEMVADEIREAMEPLVERLAREAPAVKVMHIGPHYVLVDRLWDATHGRD